MRTRTAAPRPKVDSAWFIDRMTETDGSLRGFCQRIGSVDASTMSRILSGERVMTVRHATAIAGGLRLPVTAVLERAGLAKRSDAAAPVPLVGLVDGSGRVTAQWDATTGDRVNGPTVLPAGAAALLVEDGLNQGAVLFLGAASTTAKHTGYAVVRLASGDELACLVRSRARGATILAWPGMSGVRRRDGVAIAWVRPVLWMQMP